MKEIGLWIGGAVLALIGLAVLVFWSSGLTLITTKIFGVRQADANRQVFEQSQSYNEGMLRDLEHLQAQYVAADAGGKAALKALVVHRLEVFPAEKLTPELRTFYAMLRSEP